MRRLFIPGLIFILLILPAIIGFILLLKERPGVELRIVAFDALPGWKSDDLSAAGMALDSSCQAILAMADNKSIGQVPLGGLARNWKPSCKQILGRRGLDLRQAIETFFLPIEVSVSGEKFGTFTGYYEPLLEGDFEPSKKYSIPLYGRPDDLVEVDLGIFRDDLKGRRIAGRVQNGRLSPYDDRAQISGGALNGSAKPILYVSDPVSAFFLHIQGSGRVRLPNGDIQGVGYAAQNGHPYFAIGRTLVSENHIPRDKISLQSIRAWLLANPGDAVRVMNNNASYIFFRLLGGTKGPFGSAGVPLTPGRSVAVDRKHIPLHAPIYVSASYPDPSMPDGNVLSLNRLMVAQDTGGAINGEIRADVFWGFGKEAETIAGHMNNIGRYWVLVPKSVASILEKAQ